MLVLINATLYPMQQLPLCILRLCRLIKDTLGIALHFLHNTRSFCLWDGEEWVIVWRSSLRTVL